MKWLGVLLAVLVACRAGAAAGDAVAERQVALLVAKAGSLASEPTNPKVLAMAALSCFALADRSHPLADEAKRARANEFLLRICRQYPEDANTYWILPLLARVVAGPDLARFLTPEVKAALLELLLRRVDSWFTLADAGPDEATVWRLLGSDNHDAMRKATALLTAQTLMSEPALRERRYRGGGTPAEHHAAWTRFFREYFRQRAMRGISVEMASPVYAGVSLEPVILLRDASDDAIVRRQAEQFLHLWLADAGQESLGGVRGGAKTRVYKDHAVTRYTDKLAHYTYLFAGVPEGITDVPFEAVPPLASTYRLPEMVRRLFLEPEKRGTFAYISSRAGRGGHTTPPLWYQVRFPSHLRRTTYVTPCFVLGTFTLDEAQEYTQLISQNHWMGLVAADGRESRVALVGEAPPGRDKNHHDLQAVQHLGTALLRRNLHTMYDGHLRAFVSASFTLTEDASGWLFARNRDGTVYVALRATDADAAGKRYEMLPAGKGDAPGRWVRVRNKGAFLAVEAALAAEHKTFEAFEERVLATRESRPDANTLTYHGLSAVLTMHRDAALPEVNGVPVDLNPPKTYDSPYLQAEQDSPVIALRGLDGETLTLDFRYAGAWGSHTGGWGTGAARH